MQRNINKEIKDQTMIPVDGWSVSLPNCSG